MNKKYVIGIDPAHPDGDKTVFQIVPSGRIDYCGACKKEHGYDCPLDGIAIQMAVHPKPPFLKRIYYFFKYLFHRPRFSAGAIEPAEKLIERMVDDININAKLTNKI